MTNEENNLENKDVQGLTSNTLNNNPTQNLNTVQETSQQITTNNNMNNQVVTPTPNQATEGTANNTNTNTLNNQQINNSSQNTNISDDEILLKAYIGKNYDKIINNNFNFAAFFFTSFYMFYRKMFGYGLLIYLLYIIILNFTKLYFLILVINILVGLFFNKIYVSTIKKKINKLKASNPQSNTGILETTCSIKGGTSVGYIFLGLLIQGIIGGILGFILIANGIGSFISSLGGKPINNVTKVENSTNGTLVENVIITGHACSLDDCNISIEKSNGETADYTLGVKSDIFTDLSDYQDYITLNLYLDKDNIIGYKIFLKDNNSDITNVKNINELREKIGLFSLGNHTETLTLKEIGNTGFGMSEEESYVYINYTFTDKNNNDYEMKYKMSDETEQPDLVTGNSYTVTFEVVKGSFDTEYNIKNIQ